MPLDASFDPPTNPDGFNHWWRQLCYGLDLPDPRTVPRLPVDLNGPDRAAAERFVETTANLARSALLSSSVILTFRQETDGGRVADFPAFDVQAVALEPVGAARVRVEKSGPV